MFLILGETNPDRISGHSKYVTRVRLIMANGDSARKTCKLQHKTGRVKAREVAEQRAAEIGAIHRARSCEKANEKKTSCWDSDHAMSFSKTDHTTIRTNSKLHTNIHKINLKKTPSLQGAKTTMHLDTKHACTELLTYRFNRRLTKVHLRQGLADDAVLWPPACAVSRGSRS